MKMGDVIRDKSDGLRAQIVYVGDRNIAYLAEERRDIICVASKHRFFPGGDIFEAMEVIGTSMVELSDFEQGKALAGP